MDELLRYMKALVFLQLQQSTGADTFGKPELLLARAGFRAKEIGELLGKSEGAVSKAISRGRAAGRGPLADDVASRAGTINE